MRIGLSGALKGRVRPRFRRALLWMSIILLPVTLHRAWDYIELRRLVHEVESIRSKAEPVSVQESQGAVPPLAGNDRLAGSYYMAAGMLTLGTRPYGITAPLREWLAQPVHTTESLRKVAEPLHTFVDQSQDALRLADVAASHDFRGFPPGTDYNYRTSSLGALAELIAARTLSLSVMGRGDEAVDSAISSLHMRQPLRGARWLYSGDPQVGAVLSLAEPSASALVRLQAALKRGDRPDESAESFANARAWYLERLWRRYYGTDATAPNNYTLPMRSITESVLRPWLTHRSVGILRRWAELLAVARTPWPQKADESATVLEKYRNEQGELGGAFEGLFAKGVPFAMFASAVDATPLSIDRSARVAVAVERFRRDHQGTLPAALSRLVPNYLADVPLDPLTGRPLLFRVAPDAYTIYSVGPNRKDDGGDLTSELQVAIQRGWGRRLIRGTDVGIRVLTRR